MCLRCKTTAPPLREALQALGVTSAAVTEPLLGKSPSLPAIPAETQKNSKKAKKLWDLKAQYHCPVIGTCLSVAELQKLARQADLNLAHKTDYDIHSYFVSQADESSHLTRKVHKFLDKKFSRQIKQFAPAQNAEDVLQIWHETWQRGEVSGAFWALMTHPLADATLQHIAYEQVHMLSHQIGATHTADMRKLHQLEQQQADLQGQLKQARHSLLERDQKIQTLQHQLAQAALQQHPSETMQEESINDLKQQIRRYEQQLAYTQARLHSAHADLQQQNLRTAELETALQCEQIERRALENQLEQLLAPSDCAQCQAGEQTPAWCASAHLAGHCILYVGGRDKLKPHFRSLVESYGGNFIHHDGGLHGKDQHLQQVLCQADSVFCPLDCISHNACNAIKSYCKKHNKPMVLLRTESLSAFSRGLQETFAKAA